MLWIRNCKSVFTLEQAFAKNGRSPKWSELCEQKSKDVLVLGSQIVAVGSPREISRTIQELKLGKSKRKPGLEEMDGKGKTLIPALHECHTHLLFAGHRAHEFEMRIAGATYQEIAAKGGGIANTVTATRKASSQELTALGVSRLKKFSKQGIATVEVKSGYGLSLKEELKILRVAKKMSRLNPKDPLPRLISTYLGPHSQSPDFKDLESYFSSILESHLPKVRKEKLADRVDIFIEKGFFSSHQAEHYFRVAKDLGFQFVAHAEQLSHSQGIETAVRAGATSVDHLVHASKTDILTLAKSNTTSVFLPAADFYLKIPYPKARDLIENGGMFALATDFNPGSSPTQDVGFVGLLARLEMKMSLAEVICAYTIGAAHALGIGAETSAILPGLRADLTLIDGSLNDLFYSVGNHPIFATWSGGIRIF